MPSRSVTVGRIIVNMTISSAWDQIWGSMSPNLSLALPTLINTGISSFPEYEVASMLQLATCLVLFQGITASVSFSSVDHVHNEML